MVSPDAGAYLSVTSGTAAIMRAEKELPTHLVLHPGRQARKALSALLRGGALLADAVGGGLHHRLDFVLTACQQGAV